jgi:hypothetical protein
MLGGQYNGPSLTNQMQMQYISYIFFFSLLVGLALFSCLYYIYKRFRDKTNTGIVIYLFWLAGLACLLLLGYGFEAQLRVYWLAAIPILCMVFLTVTKRVFFAALIVLFVFLSIPARYNTAPGVLCNDTELSGSRFLALEVKPQESFSYRAWNYVCFYDPNLVRIPHPVLYRYDDVSLLDNVTYIIDSNANHYFYMLVFGYDPARNWLQTKVGENTDVLYNNGYFQIYVNRAS